MQNLLQPTKKIHHAKSRRAPKEQPDTNPSAVVDLSHKKYFSLDQGHWNRAELRKKIQESSLLKEYLLHTHTLVLGLAAYAATLYIFFFIPPTQIQHTLLNNSYAPLLIVTAIAHFFFFSFLLLHTRRGFFLAIFLTALLFFQLQGVLTLQIAIGVFGILLSCELLLTMLTRK